MTNYRNPFPADPDRAEIWTMLVERDIQAYVAGDWSQVADDFLPDQFTAVNAGKRGNPDSWRLGFRAVDDYRDSWLAGSAAMREAAVDLETALYEATTLRDIEIEDDRALVHKKFDGQVRRRDGEIVELLWQTLYMCRKVEGRWRIIGFIGYLPNPMGSTVPARSAKRLPDGASQHATAGPYSPVLIADGSQLVVLSGQAAIAPDGSIVAETIEEQARATLDNCARQLATAGCGLSDVFKVNVFLTDMAQWGAFNTVYKEMMPGLLPARTAVSAGLLDGLLVEVEMWATKR